ncbi:MAG: HAMP domain-containing histidine kinase [Myxococcaceae bacterium]|nr:HAMP domain-containing histidine kinase [Myxococcaceae bacterium]
MIFEWLLKLRWGAVLCQLGLLAVCVPLLDLTVEWPGVLGVSLLGLASNAWGERLRRRGTLGLGFARFALTLDVMLFSALLYFTGGPTNPFSFLYVVYLAIGALLLDAASSWALGALAFVLLGLLYVVSPESEHHEHLKLHLYGMWGALGVAAAFIVYFVGRVSAALTERERQLEQARRLASLATLATGAAHELSTPLSTIAVVARELEKRLTGDVVRADAALIRREVERCRAILSQLAADSGVVRGEPPERVEVKAWAEAVVHELGSAGAVQVDVPGELAFDGPKRALAQALKGLVDNGLKASPAVRIEAAKSGAGVEVRVVDAGPGMPPETLARIGEPFFTTREAGSGMGLGVFLARTVAEQAGGSLVVRSQPGAGTTVTLTLPATIRRSAPDSPRV